MARVIQVGDGAFSEGDYEPIPVNTKVLAAVFEIEEGVSGPNSKNPGSPQFVYTAKVTEDGPYKGREIRYNYVPLDANAGNAWVLVAFAEAVGWKTQKGKGVEVPDDLSDVLGTEFIARIGQTASTKINEATGKPYMNNRVTGYKKVAPDGGGGGTPKPSDEVDWSKV